MNYDFDYFAGRHLKFPKKPTKPTLERNPSAIEARAFADALEEYEREMKSYEEDKCFYQSELTSLQREFRDKLKSDYSLTDAEFVVLWSEAYDRNHSGGLEEMANAFDSLYDFVLKYMDAAKQKG